MRYLQKVALQVRAKLSAVLYHKTTESNAIKILKENQFRLSTWLGGVADRPKDKDHIWYFSTSYKPGAYHKESSGVVFVLNGEKLDRHYSGEPFDYWGPEWKEIAEKSNRDLDEAEERIFSDEPTIPAADYIDEIHADWFMPNNEYAANAYKRHRELTKLAKQHGIKLYWYDDEKKLDTLPKAQAKKFSDFPPGPAMTQQALDDEGRWSSSSPYTVKKWTTLLSIEPAKSLKDIPKDVRKYLSGYTDGHMGFESDIHSASKNSKADVLRFVYKLQGQMKRVGAKTVKEFYWKMMDKLHKLEKQERNAPQRSSLLTGN